MKKRRIFFAITVIIAVFVAVIWFGRSSKKNTESLYAEVKFGDFEISVTNTGELQAKSSEFIDAPSELRTAQGIRLDAIKIQDMIPEGTVVDSGDYVATLDRTQALNAMRDFDDAILQREVDLEKAIIDSTMALRKLRDQITDLTYEVEERKLQLEQSIYEPPASQRQTEIALEKSERSLEQARNNYVLEKQKADATVLDYEVMLNRQVRRKNDLLAIMDRFEIKAPRKGMVIYFKEWGGSKRKVGSTISPWDLTVATLPDLSVMNSTTYVNEIDISRIKAGQEVRIGIDAFPDKKYKGSVTSVANIGEQLPNTDAKVFEVEILVDGYDPILRPSMTTSNTIVIKTIPEQLFLPIEAIFGMDSIPVVYTRSGHKQVVVLGESNENEIIIEQGLSEGEKVLMTPPENSDKLKLHGEELISIIQKKKEDAKKELEEQKKKSEEDQRGELGDRPDGRGRQGGPGGAGNSGSAPVRINQAK